MPIPPENDSSPESLAEAEDRRNAFEFVREAWERALASVNAGEEEVQKIVARVGGWVEGGPEEARRLGVELTERLREQREEIEGAVQSAVRRAVAPFSLPTPDDVQDLTARIDRLEDRIDRLAARRR